ncbi:MAG: hypothetical protein KKA10_07155 [Euryarchaeota archaeon]|nr:hypothetical protein [Euryarchaeota archaeon]
METAGRKQLFFRCVIVLFFAMIVLMSGCLQEKPASSQQDQTSTVPATTQTARPETTMDKVSIELSLLNSKGWGTLASDLKRPRTTTLLWYHLKKLIGFEPKVVFGKANKLNTALAIPFKMGGDSTFPIINIKGVDYYIIDPATLEIVSEFDYGYVFDDPGSVMPGYFNDFRFNTEDIALVEMWMSETGVKLSYTDFPVN